MMLTHDDIQLLTAPFAANEHDFLRGMTYLTELAITSRLDYVDPAWEFTVTRVEYGGEDRVSVFATLTVCGTSRSSCGTDKLKGGVGEPEKSATTDALKRCARLFGIGRYILGIPDNVKDVRAMDNWLRANYGAPDEMDATQAPAPKEPAPIEFLPNRTFTDDEARQFAIDWKAAEGLSYKDVCAALNVSDIRFWTASIAQAHGAVGKWVKARKAKAS
jgi:hypothetical protein